MESRSTRDPSEYNVRAIERAIDILECFDDEHPTRGVSEVAEAVGLHKATAHRIMTTLANRGFLERLHDGQEYRLGLHLVTLGFQIVRGLELPREALPYLRQVAEEYDETVDLSVYDGHEILVVQIVRSRRVLSLATTVGMRFPPHATATGKVVMAYLPETEREVVLAGPLARYTAMTVTSPEILRAQIAAVREHGYGYDDEEFQPGVRALAVPVLNRSDELMAVISMPGPVFRLDEALFPEIAHKLQEAAHGIAVAMGWQPPHRAFTVAPNNGR